jgi:GntR family transcriptional regulator
MPKERTAAADADPLEKLDSTSLSERARTAILRAILDKTFEGRLPPEEELSRMLSVSRTTIRTALHTLEQNGIITRRRAVGTTVNRHVSPSTLALQNLIGFDWLLRERGHEVRIEQSHSVTAFPPDLVDAFELEEADGLVTDKCYFADGFLALYIRDLVPRSNLVTEELPDELPASMFELSTDHCVHPIDHALARITAAVKTEEPGDTRLSLEAGRPLVRLHETHFAQDGNPVAYSVIDADNRFVHLEVFRRGAH